MADTKPWHRVYVDGYWMDKTEVTNEQFARFVKATGYVTVAERKPRAEDYPRALPENLVAGSVVFSPPDHPVELDNHFRWWSYVSGANWRHPEGPTSDIKSRMNHPVVHIAYEDAVAYCKWAGKRLPTEAEFEFASRGGLDRKRYAWGDEFMPGGKHMANTFQGHFPDTNTGEDGYLATAPVGSFPANGYGLFDMAGNVWEWTSDWYRADYYQTLAASGEIAVNPTGPADSFDPSEPGVPSECSVEDRFFAPTNIALDISQADAARANPTPEPITLAFAACANLSSNRRNLPKPVWPVGDKVARGPDQARRASTAASSRFRSKP